MKLIFELFLTFSKIGLFTFGGGYAMLSLIGNICVEKKKWITHDELMDITVIAESTPGPIAINCATYVGYKKGKLPGALLSTIGVTIPSFVVIFAISMFFESFLEIKTIANAFGGIKIAVGILLMLTAAIFGVVSFLLTGTFAAGACRRRRQNRSLKHVFWTYIKEDYDEKIILESDRSDHDAGALDSVFQPARNRGCQEEDCQGGNAERAE